MIATDTSRGAVALFAALLVARAGAAGPSPEQAAGLRAMTVAPDSIAEPEPADTPLAGPSPAPLSESAEPAASPGLRQTAGVAPAPVCPPASRPGRVRPALRRTPAVRQQECGPSGLSGWIHDKWRDHAREKYYASIDNHRQLYHPICPPYCSPTWGYYQTCWRRFPEEFLWCPGCPRDAVPPLEALPVPAPSLAPPPAPVPTPAEPN